MDGLTVDLVAGAIGGVAAVYAGQPLDTVKVKMQLFPRMYGNMFRCVAATLRDHGPRGLYAGTGPAIVSMCADTAVVFTAYGQSQRAVASAAGVDDPARLSCLQNAAAAGVASVFSSTVICPMELVKVRMQAEATCKDALSGRTAGDVARDVWNRSGPSGFYRGMTATLARECAGNAVFFGVYEWARERLRPAGGRKEDCGAAATVAAAVAAGASSCLAVYPADVVKSRAQVSGRPGLRLVLDEAGPSAAGLLAKLYSGVWPTLVKAVPVAGAMLYAVEFSKPILRRRLADLEAWWRRWRDEHGGRSWLSYRDDLSLCDFASGSAAGTLSTCIGHPLDTVRTVQQATDASLVNAIREVYIKDKFKGYFRGMLFPVLSAGVVNAVVFGVYGNTKRLIHAYRSDDDTDDVRFCCDAAERPSPYWHMDVFAAGCVAGTFYAAINTPVEVVKTTLQLTKFSSTPTSEHMKGSPKIVSPMKLIAQLYKKNGFRSLYRGGTLFKIRDVPSMGVYMLVYEHLSCKLKGLWLSGESISDDPSTQSIPKTVQTISGGLAGVVSWVCVLPFDVIKSKMIADDPEKPKYNGVWDCVLKTYRQGGTSHFFRGFWMLCLRAFVVNGITFVTYEMLLKTCNRYDWNKPTNEPGPVAV